MNTLLLALLVSGTVITPARPSATVGTCPDDMCAAGQVYRAIYYYSSQGGSECGLSYQYCDGTPRYHDGCTTSYYDQDFFCCCQ